MTNAASLLTEYKDRLQGATPLEVQQKIAGLEQQVAARDKRVTQVELAKHRLFGDDGLRASNFKIFPGTSREVTAQQIAEQVNKVVAQLEEGDFDLVEAEDD